MTAASRQNEVLTREELDALLETLAEESEARAGGGAAPFRTEAGPDESPLAHPALYRALEGFGIEQSRHLSNIYQSRIEYRTIGWDSLGMEEAADTLLDQDRVALFEMKPSGGLGFIWLNRPLLYALLSLSFGARPGAGRFRCPQRPYTGIELRVYRRCARETLVQLDRAWRDFVKAPSEVVSIDSPARLRELAGVPVLLASFDIRGLGDICRMRVGLPEAAFAACDGPPRPVPPARTGSVEGIVSEMPLDLRVELGSMEMSISQLARLRAGSLLPIDASEDGTLLVRVEGQPKFRGIRGSVGKRLSVQLTERLEGREV